jgi:hypothetical protein
MKPTDYNFNSEDDIEVTATDTTYNLSGKEYYYDNDTLFVTAFKQLDERTKLEYTINIPVNSIEKVEVKNIDTFNTTILIGIIVIAVLGLVFIFSLGDNYSSSGLLQTTE